MNLPKKHQKLNLNLKAKKIHFIGIGGIGMSALARYFHVNGSIISGSDKDPSSQTASLIEEGIQNIWTPHCQEKLKLINPDYVIYSTAVTEQNEELLWAKQNSKNILHRSELLEIACASKKIISVSGTHGKTTTTALISHMLELCGKKPSAILGGILIGKNTNIIIGDGDYFVIESDESDKSFLRGEPEITVITNIEEDHLENYNGSFEEVKNSFLTFAKKGVNNGVLIACFEDKNTKELITNNFDLTNLNIITYGFHSNNNCFYLSTHFNKDTKSWDVFLKGNYLNSVNLRFGGNHNALNMLAAYCTGCHLGLDPNKIKEAIESYKGVERRFQLVGKIAGITIIDDYAHHPTEIYSTIQAAKELNPSRLIIVLQPHQPTRLRDLWSEYIKILSKFEDLIFVTDTYIARGASIEGITSEKLVSEIGKPNIKYIPGKIDEITKYIKNIIKPKDFVLIMGAGDITLLGKKLLGSYETLVTNSGNN